MKEKCLNMIILYNYYYAVVKDGVVFVKTLSW